MHSLTTTSEVFCHSLVFETARVRKQIWANNPQERLNKALLRRTDVVRIFPDLPSMICLVGAALAEQHDGWAEMGSVARAIDTDSDPEPRHGYHLPLTVYTAIERGLRLRSLRRDSRTPTEKQP